MEELVYEEELQQLELLRSCMDMHETSRQKEEDDFGMHKKSQWRSGGREE